MIKVKIWFTLIEIIVTITILSIVTIYWYNWIFKDSDQRKEILDIFEENNLSRFNELYDKSLIWVNWHYNNNGVKKADYIKVYCDNTTKKIKAYICDNKNSIVDVTFKNCIQIDYPDFNNLKFNWRIWDLSDEYSISNCWYRDVNNVFSNWNVYAKILLNFPYWIKVYWENLLNTKADENDDFEVNTLNIMAKKDIFTVDFKLYEKGGN